MHEHDPCAALCHVDGQVEGDNVCGGASHALNEGAIVCDVHNCVDLCILDLHPIKHHLLVQRR